MKNNASPHVQPGAVKEPRSKKGAVIGLTAGLVGGSLAGFMFGVPGISSASSALSEAPAAIVQQTDDTTTDDTTTDDTTPADPADTTDATDAAPAERGTRLRESLQTLVDDGTLTAEQADAVTTHLVESLPERGGHGGGHGGDRGGLGGFGRSEVLTDLLGIDAATLREQLRSGSTLAEIAEANGVASDELIAALVAEAGERLDTAVENGRLTAEEAAEKLAEIETRIADKINGN